MYKLNKRYTLILLLIILLVAMAGQTNLPPRAHGETAPTGVVCISPSLTSCPQTSFTFNATSGSTLSVNVVVQNTPAANAFDVYVKADQSILSAPADSTGYTVGSDWPIVAQVCINGMVILAACSPNDAPGIVHIVSGTLGAVSGDSTLFTIHYSVVGTTSGTPIQYQTGCSNTSIPDGTCVTLLNPNTNNPDPENIETADFTNLAPTANFFATPLTGLVPLTVTFDASLSKPTTGTSNTISSYNWAFGDQGIANLTTATTTHTYSAVGGFTPTLYVLDSGNAKSKIKAGQTIEVVRPDFSILASPNSFTGGQSLITGGASRNATIILKSLNQFSGTISLTVKLNTTALNAPTATLSQPSVILRSGTTNSSTQLTLRAAQATLPGDYAANVTATSGILAHSFLLNFTVIAPDFSIGAPSTVTIAQGGSLGQISLTIKSLARFNGTVSLTTREPSNLLASINPPTAKVNVSITQVSTTLAIAVLSGTLPGDYVVRVVGTSGMLSHNVNVTVTVPSTNFVITISPTSLSMEAGTSSNATLILTGTNGYSSTPSSPLIVLTSNSSSTLGVTATPTPGNVSITTPNGFAAATLMIATGPSTPAGSYMISVNATDGTTSHSGNIALTVTAPIASVQLGAITLSTTSTVPGNHVSMNVTVTNTRAGSVSLTVYMAIYGGTGSNFTVDSKTVTLSSTQPQTVALTWDTGTFTAGTYHVYTGIIGQTSPINQSASAGSVTLNTQAQSGIGILASLAPGLAAAEAAVIAMLVVFFVINRRRRAAT